MASKKQNIRNGIAAYGYEQRIILRLLRKRGKFTDKEFDSWFKGREYRRPIRMTPLSNDSFILGIGLNGGNYWAVMLELLQVMICLDMVQVKEDNGRIVYFL